MTKLQAAKINLAKDKFALRAAAARLKDAQEDFKFSVQEALKSQCVLDRISQERGPTGPREGSV